MQADLLEAVIHYALLEAPTGDWIGIAADRQRVVRIAPRTSEKALRRELAVRFPFASLQPKTCAVLEAALRQLCEYLEGRRRAFELPVRLSGTPFQMRVWRALQRIPYGETRSYGEVARMVGGPGAARAVGAANGANPVAIVVPCHRVIQSDGRLGGYGGGRRIKQFLLDLERRVSAACGPRPESR